MKRAQPLRYRFVFPDSLASRCIWEPGSCAKMHIQSVKTLYLSILYTVNDSEIIYVWLNEMRLPLRQLLL